MNFEQKVKSMTASQIIMAMVDGLKAEHVKVRMASFGSTHGGVCVGCAATNAICEISGVVFTPKNIFRRDLALMANCDFVSDFEGAIDALRAGDVDDYNVYAENHGFAVIQEVEGLDLPFLDTENYLENLDPYIRLAEAQPDYFTPVEGYDWQEVFANLQKNPVDFEMETAPAVKFETLNPAMSEAQALK